MRPYDRCESKMTQPREFASGTAATLKTCIPGQDQLESSVSRRDAQVLQLSNLNKSYSGGPR